MNLVYSAKTRDFKKKAVFRCSPNIRSQLIQNKFVHIDYDECPCSDHFFVPQCTNCGQFGNTTKKCDAKTNVCLYCSGDHTTKDCHCCINCSMSPNHILREGAKNHNAFSRNCPVYLNEVSKVSLRIDYGCDYVTYSL